MARWSGGQGRGFSKTTRSSRIDSVGRSQADRHADGGGCARLIFVLARKYSSGRRCGRYVGHAAQVWRYGGVTVPSAGGWTEVIAFRGSVSDTGIDHFRIRSMAIGCVGEPRDHLGN